ncbi:MAG: hypothetical protein WC421_08165 [Elusimicrobiales bacterium]
MKSSIKAAVAAAVFAVAAGALIFFKLGSVPGFSADEAWTGLRAMEIRHSGLASPHGMNWYTGPFHAWLAAKVFGWAGPSVFSLRLAGAALNTAAAGAMAFFVALTMGMESLLVLGALLLALPFFPFESRIAWEVCALNNFLAAAVIISAWRLTTKRCLAATAVLIYASCIGTLNHIIFLSLPFALVFGILVWSFGTGNVKFGALLPAALANLACAGTLLLCKKFITDGFWLAHKNAMLAVFFGLPALTALAAHIYHKQAGGLSRALMFIAAALPPTRKGPQVLAAAGLLAWLWFHATAFLGLVSGYNVFRRLFSLELGVIAAAALLIWAAVVTGAVLAGAIAALKSENEDSKLLAAILLAGYMATFTAFRNTNSMRYYIINFFLFALAGAAFLPEFLRRSGGRMRIFLALGLAGIFFVSGRELLEPRIRKPFQFRQGWHGETSARMMSVDWLAQKMKNDKICRFGGDPFIAMPLEFMYKAENWPCDTAKRFDGNYCYVCDEAPYIR